MELIILRYLALLLYFYAPPFIAHTINVFADMFDCPLSYLKETFVCMNLFPKNIRCNTGHEYQIQDKLLDTIMNTFAIMSLYFYGSKYFKILLYLYLFRLCGTVLYFITGNRKMFSYFPNFFNYFFIYLTGLEYFQINNFSYIIVILLIVVKIVNEYYFHYSR